MLGYSKLGRSRHQGIAYTMENRGIMIFFKVQIFHAIPAKKPSKAAQHLQKHRGLPCFTRLTLLPQVYHPSSNSCSPTHARAHTHTHSLKYMCPHTPLPHYVPIPSCLWSRTVAYSAPCANRGMRTGLYIWNVICKYWIDRLLGMWRGGLEWAWQSVVRMRKNRIWQQPMI